jgi:DtxR family Mn-dependent transcriptional regulator
VDRDPRTDDDEVREVRRGGVAVGVHGISRIWQRCLSADDGAFFSASRRVGVTARRYDRPMSSPHATVAEEEYLQTLFWLHEAGLPMTGANLARAMQLSAPTVHEMVRRLEDDGYITRAKDKMISFTDEGLEHATGIVSRHRLIERYLTDVVGVPWDDVHEEAERLEHAMSPRFEAYMRAAIGEAKTCPHGHPIEVGSRLPGVPLADVEVGATVRILRFENEAEDLLHYLKQAGIEPGLEGTVAARDEEEVVLDTGADEHPALTTSVAATVTVQADPSPPPRVTLPEHLVLAVKRYGR